MQPTLTRRRDLAIGQKDALLALGFHKENDLIVLKLDHFPLPVVNPAKEDGQQELPGLQNEAHGVLRMLIQE